jgi:D-tyrosyl-tRNA(Tyr) deacylase
VKALVQRVHRATVFVGDIARASIGPGLLVFVGIERGDTGEDAAYLARKLAKIRVFEDERGKMSLSVGEIGGEILLVSAFTLLGQVRRGLRPDFTQAEEPDRAARLFDHLSELLAREGVTVRKGIFGSHMDIDFVNDGPVAIVIDTRE